MQKSEWAAWTQALFSVVAIAVAIFVPLAQHHREVQRLQQRERQESLDQLEIWAQLLSGGAEKIRIAEESLSSERSSAEWVASFSSELSTIIAAAEKLDVSMLRSYEPLEAAVAGLSGIRAARDHAANVKGTGHRVGWQRELSVTFQGLAGQVRIRAEKLRNLRDKGRRA